MKRDLKVTTATKSKLVADTNFYGYDYCLNPYVGCQFGCSYCYVRFFLSDPDKGWGEFVRVREHVTEKLPKELPDLAGFRVVLGTMTDPYQPVERKHRITRKILTLIDKAEEKPNKVGIFTRSPIILDDLSLVARMPRARVHFTVTPYDHKDMKLIEPIAISMERRFDTIQKLKEAGIRVHVNVAPAIPVMSDHLTPMIAEKLAELGVDEFFVDPMQAYNQSFEELKASMTGDSRWPQIEATMTDKQAYNEWKEQYKNDWIAAWKIVKVDHALPIWCDHISRTWVNMNTEEQMRFDLYNDDMDCPQKDLDRWAGLQKCKAAKAKVRAEKRAAKKAAKKQKEN